MSNKALKLRVYGFASDMCDILLWNSRGLIRFLDWNLESIFQNIQKTQFLDNFWNQYSKIQSGESWPL